MTRKQLISGLAGLGLVLGSWTGCYISRGLTPLDLDNDRDGFDESVDCDDDNAAIYPGAVEICSDGVDNDCDGKVDSYDPECDPATGGSGGTGGSGTGGSGGSSTGGSGGSGTGGSGGSGTGGSAGGGGATGGGGGAGGSSSSGAGGSGGSGTGGAGGSGTGGDGGS
jgi:hypothetical protein